MQLHSFLEFFVIMFAQVIFGQADSSTNLQTNHVVADDVTPHGDDEIQRHVTPDANFSSSAKGLFAGHA